MEGMSIIYEQNYKKVIRDHVPYDIWLGKKLVYATEGNVIHYGYIEKFIDELGKMYNIKEIAFDRCRAVQMTQNLEVWGLQQYLLVKDIKI